MEFGAYVSLLRETWDKRFGKKPLHVPEQDQQVIQKPEPLPVAPPPPVVQYRMFAELDHIFDGAISADPKVADFVNRRCKEWDQIEGAYRNIGHELAGSRDSRFEQIDWDLKAPMWARALEQFRRPDGKFVWGHISYDKYIDAWPLFSKVASDLPEGVIILSPDPELEGQETVRLYRGFSHMPWYINHSGNFSRYSNRINPPEGELRAMRQVVAGEIGIMKYFEAADYRHRDQLKKDYYSSWDIYRILGITSQLAQLAYLHYHYEIGRWGASPFVSASTDPLVAKQFMSERGTANVYSDGSIRGMLVMDVPTTQAVRLCEAPGLGDFRIEPEEYGIIGEVPRSYIRGIIPGSRKVSDEVLLDLISKVDQK